MDTSLPPPPTFDPAKAARLRELLNAAGVATIHEKYDEILQAPMPRRARKPLLLRAVRKPDADEKTAILVAMGEQLPAPKSAFGDELLELLLEAGLLDETDDGEVVSRLITSNLDGQLIVSDPMGVHPDTVMAVGPGTERLAALLPPDLTGQRVLDLGAGPGSVAMVAAARGADAVATDLSPRCVEFMHANATLNGIALDIRLGDLYEPVAGEEFDFVVSHPPYVEQPEDVEQVLFLHGGESGEELPFRVLAGVADVLVPGGHAIIEFHASGAPDEVGERIRELVSGAGCDLALFTVRVHDPDARAVSSALMHDPDFGPGFDDAVISYRDHLDRIGHEGTAAIVYMRKRAPELPGEKWATMISAERLPTTWATLARYVHSIDVLQRGDEVLEATMVRAPGGAQLVLEMPLGEANPEREFSVRLPPDAFAANRGFDAGTARLLDLLCEAPTVGAAIAMFSNEVSGDPEEIRKNVVAFVRENIVRGVLAVHS